MPPEEACALDDWRLIPVGRLLCWRTGITNRRLRILYLQSRILLELIDQISRFSLLLLLRFWLWNFGGGGGMELNVLV